MFFSRKQTPASPAAEWAMAIASLWFLGGLFLDGWAHNHVPELETFFTPWHAVFYTGYFAVAFTLLTISWQNKGKKKWKDAIPAGYEYAALGTGIFLLGGIGDMIWHEIFGVESDIEALLSPTHLVLATGMIMIFSGGLLSWWKKSDKERSGGYIRNLPMILSVTFIYAMLAFMTQYSHFIDLAPAGFDRPRDSFYPLALSITGNLLHFAVLMGTLFMVMRRGRPPFGFVTTLFTLSVLAMGLMIEHEILAIGAAFTGVIADVSLRQLFPLEKHRAALRLFAFGVPAVFMCYYFPFIIFAYGTWWSVHMWTGSVFLAGVAGLLLSFVAWPPQES